MKVICVIPAYDRSHRLPAVVEGLRKVLDDIVIVNDGSAEAAMDGILETLPADILKHPINRGQGAALKTGTEYALSRGADVIVHFDADGQFRPEDIPAMLAPLLAGEADVVFGSRFLNAETNMPVFKKKILMPIARTISRWLFNIRLTDPQSGFRAMTSEAARAIDWQQDRWAHASEILLEAHSQPLRIAEVPIVVLYHEFGRSFGDGLGILRDLFLGKLNK